MMNIFYYQLYPWGKQAGCSKQAHCNNQLIRYSMHRHNDTQLFVPMCYKKECVCVIKIKFLISLWQSISDSLNSDFKLLCSHYHQVPFVLACIVHYRNFFSQVKDIIIRFLGKYLLYILCSISNITFTNSAIQEQSYSHQSI